MPRGKRKPALESIGEQLEKIDAELEIHRKKIDALQTQKKALLDRKKKLELETLYDKIRESGKSVDELLALAGQK